MFRKLPMNQHGQSLVEILVGLAIMVVLGLIFASGLIQMKNMSETTNLASREDKQVINILENARSTIAVQQITGAAVADSWNLAWGNGEVVLASTCPNPDKLDARCPGRLQYVVKPVPLAGGVTQHDLYQIELKMKHLKWGDRVKTYTLLASPK